MTLFSLAWRNIKRNLYDYFLYYISMVFSIMIYFTFISIKYNEQVIQLGEVRERIASAFTASSVVLAIFAFIFIWYSNSFFTRKRKKEIALYSLLGIKKKQIGRMLFYENIVMGICALLVGIFLGSLLSKVFIMLLIRLMGFSASIEFSIIPGAIFGTLKMFTLVFLLTSIHGYMIIYRFKLVDLFKAERSAEKEPRASITAALLSILFIGGGYCFYLTCKTDFLFQILITLISVVTGTFLFFSSMTVFIIKLAKKNRARYFKGINMIGTANLLYRIKGHARTLALIAVLSATTLTAVSVTASLYYDFKTKLDMAAPFSYVYMSNLQKISNNLGNEIEKVMNNYPSNPIEESIEYEVIEVKADMPVGNGGSYLTGNVYLISKSEYIKTARLNNQEVIKLAKRNDTLFIDEYYNDMFKESYTGKTIKLHTKLPVDDFKIIDYKTLPIFNVGFLRRTMVVKDEVFNMLKDTEHVYWGRGYIVDNEKNSEQLTEEISKLITRYNSSSEDSMIKFSSFYQYYRAGIINFGQAIFIGGFLGLVFLLSTGSIIFFKLLSEANEEKIRYNIIKNIGVTGKEIKSLLSRQIMFFFAVPLIVGVIHSLVAVSIMERFLSTDLTVPITVSILTYIVIYMFYYLLTVKSYNEIVN